MSPFGSIRASPIGLGASWYQTTLPSASTPTSSPRFGGGCPATGEGAARLVTGNSVMPGAIFVGSLVTVNGGMSAGSAPVVNVTGSAVVVWPLAPVAVIVNAYGELARMPTAEI